MGIRHLVQKGDTLWGLAGIYLGNGSRYPKIVEYHNQEAARHGLHSRLLPIKDPNLIYVGQTILLPEREKNPAPGTGMQHQASNRATGIDLKLEYTFEEGRNPIRYQPVVTKDYTIVTEMTGKISIENDMDDNYRHNFEIAMCWNKSELTSKLEFGDRAIAELTRNVETQFDMATGKVTLKASIAAKADVGPYIATAICDAPNHFSYTLKPQPINATVKSGRRRYKFNAEIAFKIDVTLHPGIKQERPQPKVWSPEAADQSEDAIGPITVLGIITAYILIVLYGPKCPLPGNNGLTPRYAPALNMPLLHPIHLDDPRLKA